MRISCMICFWAFRVNLGDGCDPRWASAGAKDRLRKRMAAITVLKAASKDHLNTRGATMSRARARQINASIAGFPLLTRPATLDHTFFMLTSLFGRCIGVSTVVCVLLLFFFPLAHGNFQSTHG